LRSSSPDSEAMSVPSKEISPDLRRAGGRSIRVSAKPSVDLPQPDSPTRPTNSPCLSVRPTSRTAQMPTPRAGSYKTLTPLASSNGFVSDAAITSPSLLPQAGIRQGVDAEVDEREGRREQRDRETRREHQQPLAGQQRILLLRVVEDGSPAHRVRVAEAEEFEARLGHHGCRRRCEEARRDERGHVRQDLPEHDPEQPLAG